MKNWQYFAIQSNLCIVLALVSTWTPAKIIFMTLAILQLVAMWGSRND